jgi:hypothetical protein
MKLQNICEQYAAFRKALGERFEVNGRQLKAFCRALGKTPISQMSRQKRWTLFSLAKARSQPVGT